MKKQTVVDQIEVTRSGDIQVRMAKQIVDDEEVVAQEWHRTVIQKHGDVEAQMEAVGDHLMNGLGYPALSGADVVRIKTIAEAAWGVVA